MIRIVFQSEARQLKRNKIILTMLAIFVLLGMYSIYYGHQAIAVQNNKITAATDSVERLQAAYLKLFNADTTNATGKNDYEKATMPSLVRFNYNFLAANRPTPLAALTIGQRDLFPLYYVLNGQSLYVQTLKGEIYNPFKLAAGNFDLAFVIIYLLPLLIIALSFDVLSAERGMGTEKLLRTTTIHFKKIILLRLTFRLLVVLILTAGICIAAFFIADEVDVLAAFLWMLVTGLYITFWFGINLLINTYQKNGSFNALAALSVWLITMLIIPSGISLLIKNQRKTHGLQMAGLMRSRNMPETDEAMYNALKEFYRYYPQYRPADNAKSKYFYFQGYSAFLFNGDHKAQKIIATFNKGLAADEQHYGSFNFINPAANVQDLFNTLARTGLADEWKFKRAVEHFHRNIFWFANRPLFQNRLMTQQDYKLQPVFKQVTPDLNYKAWLINLLWLATGTGIIYFFALIKLK